MKRTSAFGKKKLSALSFQHPARGLNAAGSAAMGFDIVAKST
jgi:hypothetical protein